jgi:hypothetical protein
MCLELEFGCVVDVHAQQQSTNHQALHDHNPASAASEPFAIEQIDYRRNDPLPRPRRIQKSDKGTDCPGVRPWRRICVATAVAVNPSGMPSDT